MEYFHCRVVRSETKVEALSRDRSEPSHYQLERISDDFVAPGRMVSWH